MCFTSLSGINKECHCEDLYLETLVLDKDISSGRLCLIDRYKGIVKIMPLFFSVGMVWWREGRRRRRRDTRTVIAD